MATDAVQESWNKRFISKIQQTIITFKGQIDKLNGRIINVDSRVKILEQFMCEKPEIDIGGMMDIRARLTTLNKKMENDLGSMLQIMQKMRESEITQTARIELLEQALQKVDPKAFQTYAQPQNKSDSIQEDFDKTDEMLKDLAEDPKQD